MMRKLFSPLIGKCFLNSNFKHNNSNNKVFCLIQKRGRKYIPFYDINKKKQKKKGFNEVHEKKKEDDENEIKTDKRIERDVDNIESEKLSQGDNIQFMNKKKEYSSSTYSIRSNLLPALSPMKGLKLLLSLNDSNYFNMVKNDDSKINFNLIIRIDIKRESLRGMCNLVHSVDKNKKILVLVDEEHQNLKKYGADYVGLEYINKIKNGWLDFNICITNFKNINKILCIAKILGPKKLMPNIKSDTLVDNLEETIKKIKSGNTIEYRSEPIDLSTFQLYNEIYNFQHIDLNSVAHINVQIAPIDMNFYHILENMKCFTSEIIKNNIHSTHTQKENKTTSFTWPPITAKHKKQKLKIEDKINLFHKNDDSSQSFILGGYITYGNYPKIFLRSNLLHPHSDGYSN
ncbi:50S ribosomal protein L1, mitochondrial, putative [Plasmodium sp. gorilla clade G2]|uniref:50S ribosomal protein L1, mitochondrial, putative n=1 Tax=Plasmodium sp. gorilla clade G2 TaxID=880535 RepID=UPI000D2245C3|nr:50S ribosomal protein L1, mitochondrial, putative [Plasmodium sp. gorilla clade G2]SOV12973.1 50S ribosomal protein L1, mitochondrial, putative [Plasmodium sp. gorilla clade G2]